MHVTLVAALDIFLLFVFTTFSRVFSSKVSLVLGMVVMHCQLEEVICNVYRSLIMLGFATWIRDAILLYH